MRVARLQRDDDTAGPALPARAPRNRSEDTKQRILKAALHDFASNGLAGARIDEIAARADVNKRMIYAYFGNKEALWMTVLTRAYAAKREQENALHVMDLPPPQAMARLVSFNLRYTADHPEFVALLNQENLHRGSYLARSDDVRRLYTPLLDTMRTVLDRGVAEGVFRDGVDPVQLYITIVGIGHFYVANQHTLGHNLDTALMSPAALDAREAHCIDVVLGYLRP